MKISPARRAAFDVLIKIEKDHAFSSVLLPIYEDGLSAVDRSLCHELVLGVLRRQLLLDRYIETFTEGRKLDLEVRVALRLGVFQLYFLDRVPDHAAVNESVGLAVRAKKSSARGLVNAVLRAALCGRPELAFSDDLDRISIETSHPQWLIERWAEQREITAAETLARSNNETPSIAFRRTLKGADTVFSEAYTPSEYVSNCFIAQRLTPELRGLSDQGLIYFQDEASQMVAAAVDLSSHQRFLDVCASPGGKTTAVAASIGGKSGLVIAGDITARRVGLLYETCVKQNAAHVLVVQYDAANALPFAERVFDCVLVDAPCTGTGTISHNPEIRYLVQPDDLGRMHKTQLAILKNAARHVRPGGRIIYSTCSLEPEEDEDVCNAFVLSTAGFRQISPAVPKRFITPDGYARTFPDRDAMDGFFIAAFARS